MIERLKADDPYSHTPAGRGAQQPGMTGQVKEDILCRWGEFGVYAQGGKLFFNSTIIRTEEYLEEDKEFVFYDVNNKKFSPCSLRFIRKVSNPIFVA